ncbi:hypothetical protein X777_06685 [Ooceraea biroi]|uniref:Uncharacterized protein n=1 Tax=Ooceraea biroi TaxID=2015173 RepID=A0A026WFJ1_OOCBI|nr:hypothetical protein X777_06685 [Ooceraea biroi]
MEVGRPRYLRKKGEKGSQKVIARWRCGNEEEKNKFWLTEGKRKCQICEETEGELEHIMTHVKGKNRLRVKEVLDEVVRWMREVEKVREKLRKEREGKSCE